LLGHQSVESVEQVLECLLELWRGAVFGQFDLESFDVVEPVEVERPVGVRFLGLGFLWRLLGRRGLDAEEADLVQEVSEWEAGEGPVGHHHANVAEAL
jgi:hypothetical protein